MKIRNGYVSNSSSSSFIIAYDKKFFGDLISLLINAYVGCETCFPTIKQLFDNLSKEDKKYYRNLVEQKRNEGKTVEYLELDRDYIVILDLLKQINEQNGGDKIEILFKD